MVQLEPIVSVSSTMVWWAFKYAITPCPNGKNVLSTVDVVENMLAAWDQLPEHMRASIVEHIQKSLHRSKNTSHQDAYEWQRILDQYYSK